MKKIYSKQFKQPLFVLLILTQVLSTPFSVFAQEATTASNAAEPKPELSLDRLSSTGAILNTIYDSTQKPEPSVTLADEKENTSASLKQRSYIRSLIKKNYRADESVSVIVSNPQEPTVETTVFDPDGIQIVIETKEIVKENQVEVQLIPPVSLRPGRYHVNIEDSTGQKLEQDFTWGVLAINPNKSVYTPGEQAKLAIAVLDEQGMMVCDASVVLQIVERTTGEAIQLSTEEKTIRVNPECFEHDFTINPDYETELQTGTVGTYDMQLSATTKNGTYSITDSFVVKDSIPLSVERAMATRIFPPKTYPVELKVTAHEDFSGTVTEIVPASFITTQNPETKPFEEVQTISTMSDAKDDVLGVSTVKLIAPVGAKEAVSLGFGEQLQDPGLRTTYAQFGLSGHDGVDFDVPTGTNVFAVDEGEVVLAKKNGDYGTTLVLQHSWGRSYYGHLSEMEVKFGDIVNQGHTIAKSGETGLTTGPHLHFGIKPNTAIMENGYYGKVNPAPYVGLETRGDVSYDVKVLRWNVSLKKGESTTLGYAFKTPNISPQFYLLGPLKFFSDDGEMVFQEERSWQLAIDAEVNIDATVNTAFANHNYAGSKTVFTNDTDGYVFYQEQNGTCVYSKTIDSGASWTGPFTVDSQTDCVKVSVWYDQWTPGDNSGSLIHIITADTSADDVWYRTLDTSTDTLSTGPVAISSAPGPAKTNSFDGAVTLPVITKGTDGTIYVGVHDNTASDNSFIIRCSSTCTTASNWSDAGTLPLDTGATSANDMLVLMPLAGGDILAIRHDDSADDVQSKVWNGSAWDGSWTNIDTTVPNHNTYDSTIRATVNRSTGDIYLAYLHDFNDFSTADHDIQTAIYSGGTWTNTTDAVTNSNDGTASGIFTDGLAIGIDENSGDVYLAYSAGSANDEIFYKVSSDAMLSWSTRTTISLSAPLADAAHGLNMNLMSDERLYADWYFPSTDILYGETVADLVPASAGPSMDQLMRHGAWFNSSGVEQPFTF